MTRLTVTSVVWGGEDDGDEELKRIAVVEFGGGFGVELAQAADDLGGAGAPDGFGFAPAADGE